MRCNIAYLGPHHPPLQQQPWELCFLQLWNQNKQQIVDTVHTMILIRGRLRALWVPGLGRVSANLLRLVRLSAPSWFRIPGSISVSCLFSACPVIVKVLAAKEAWTLGLLKWITVPWFVNIFTFKEIQMGLKGTMGKKNQGMRNLRPVAKRKL